MGWHPCCCDTCEDCTPCAPNSLPNQVVATIENVFSGDPALGCPFEECNEFNRTFVLDRVDDACQGQPCTWVYSGDLPCDYTHISFRVCLTEAPGQPSCNILGTWWTAFLTFHAGVGSDAHLVTYSTFNSTPPWNTSDCCSFLNGLVLRDIDASTNNMQCGLQFLQQVRATLFVDCDTGVLISEFDADPIRFGFLTAALTGAAAASATVPGATFTVTGSLTGGGDQIQASSQITFTASAAWIATSATSGTTSFAFSTTGSARLTGALSGSTSLTFSTSALAAGLSTMSGSTSLTFTTLVTMSLSGMTEIAFTTSGQMTATGAAAGSTALTFTPSASLKGSGAMTGACNFGFSNTGNLRGTAPLSGNTSLTFAPSASGSSAAPLAGTTTVTFVNAGALRASGRLSGNVLIEIVEIEATPLGAGRLTGTTTVTFSPSASLKGSARATGMTALTFSNIAHLSLSASKAGITSITFATLGALRGSRLISGNVLIEIVEVEATLKGAGRLSGPVLIEIVEVEASPLGTGRLTGTSNVAFTTSGAMRGTGRLSGPVLIEIVEVEATLQGGVQFTGTSTIGIIPTGAMRGTRNISGNVLIEIVEIEATPQGSGRLTGTTSIQFTPSGLLTGEEEECETPCENCGSESTPSTITLRLANGCQCFNCASNTPDTYTVGFEGIISAGDLACATCDHFFSSYVLDRVSSGSESGTCKWEYTTTFCGRTYVLRLEIDSIFVTLQWLDGARVEASWRWEHGGASPNCSGSNIESNLVFQSSGDGDGDCIWAGVTELTVTSSGSCTVVNDGCGSCSSLLGDYVLEQNPGDPTNCQYIGLFSTACGEMSLSITFSSNGISGGIGLGGVPQAGMQLTQTAPYNCALTVSLGRMTITSTECNFRNVVPSIIGTTPCT